MMTSPGNVADGSKHTRLRSFYWWSRPSGLVLFALVPIYLYCGSMDEVAFSLYNHPKNYLVGNSFVVGLFALLAFAIGSASCERRKGDTSEAWVQPERARYALSVLFCLVLIAYGVFFLPLLQRPQIVLDHLRGSQETMAELRAVLNRIPGFTSLVALQSLCVVLSLNYERLTGERLAKGYWVLTILVAICCASRAWLWSERLALIELIVPAAIARYASIDRGQKGLSSRLLMLAPLAGLTVMFAIFAVGEYFRSWQYYKDYLPYSFIEFSWTRFLGYYATALANGALVHELHQTDYVPLMTALWFYKIPLWSWLGLSLSGDPVSGVRAEYDYSEFLLVYLNPEFNNLSGVFMPTRDFGAPLGIACWLGLGMLSGVLYRSFASGQIFGLMFYPTWFVGVAEILRLFYWGESRFSPVAVFGLLLVLYLRADLLRVRRRVFLPLLAFCLFGYCVVGSVNRASADVSTEECRHLASGASDHIADVRTFGARGDGASDDGHAIQAAIDSLPRGGTVVLPQGTYAHSNVIRLRHDDIVLAGQQAVLLAINASRAAVIVEGSSNTVRDLVIRSMRSNRRGDRLEHAGLVLQGQRSSAINNAVEDSFSVGIFVSGARGFLVGCNRVSRTKADGIHVTQGASAGKIINNIVFNSEDDGIAIVSYDARRQVSDVLVENNRVEHIPWGRGIAVVGSAKITVSRNSVTAIAVAAGILVAREAAWHTPGAVDVLIEGNDINDIQQSLSPLGNRQRTGHAAIELNSDSRDPSLAVRDVRVVDNAIRGSARDGVRLLGNVCQASIERNAISYVGGRAISVIEPMCAIVISLCKDNRYENSSAACEEP